MRTAVRVSPLWLTPLVLAACGGEAPLGTDSAAPRPSFVVVPPDEQADIEQFEVCKYGSAGNFSFTMTDNRVSPPAVTGGTFSLIDGECSLIALAGGKGADVSVTETSAASGFQLDHVVVTTVNSSGTSSVTVSGPTVGGSIGGATAPTGPQGILAQFYNVPVPPPPPPPPPPGGEGCTPGYWKQAHHFDSWVGYAPTDLIATVFGRPVGGTLLDGLQANGGGLNALLRHTVAALLNTNAISFELTSAQVIAAFQAAYDSGNYHAQKDAFAALNERVCPLN
jgi:hypothetical protein